MISSYVNARMGSVIVRDGVAGRFRGKKWAKKFGPKKALLSSRRAASLLYTLYKRWCKCCGAEWYGVGRARLNKPIPTRPPLLPELARAKDINQGGRGCSRAEWWRAGRV